MENLDDLRQEINEVDEKLTRLLEKRFNIVDNIAEYKKKNDIPILNNAREKEVLERNLSLLENKELSPYIESILRNIMKVSKEYQSSKNITVGFQGVEGSFSHEAVLKFTKGTSNGIKSYETFDELCNALLNDEITFAVMPFENTSTGAVVDVYDLLLKYGFYIHQEICVKAVHNLLAKAGAKLSDINEVYSHQQAFMQCKEFLREHNFKQIPYYNTAISAKFVSESNRDDIAAIASVVAAEKYSLKVLEPNINFNSVNITKFVVLSKKEIETADANRICMVFELDDLNKLLNVFSLNNIKVVKAEPRPKLNSIFEYLYFIDFEGNINDEKINDVIKSLKKVSKKQIYLGNYIAADKEINNE